MSSLDREDITAGTVNVHRETMHAIFEFARREETYGLQRNLSPRRRNGRWTAPNR
jgi:hypothetical protein